MRRSAVDAVHSLVTVEPPPLDRVNECFIVASRMFGVCGRYRTDWLRLRDKYWSDH
jgi:hypothetical protein